MKKILTIVALTFVLGTVAHAQNLYDALKIGGNELNGTARFVGMGGAMSALGGDVSTIGTNPAGIGIFRRSDFATSFSFNMITAGEQRRNRMSYDNLGIVLTSHMSDYSSLRFVNFGFNYSRHSNFYKNLSLSRAMTGMSMAQSMAEQAYMMEETNGVSSDDLNADNAWDNDKVGWLGALGWRSGLLDRDDQGFFSIIGSGLNADALTDNYYESRENGGINQYDFNVAFNINDRFYLGFTLGTYGVDYRKDMFYQENWKQYGTGFDLNSWSKIDGNGFDLKMGMIVRPFESSPLRLGFAVHTPTFYKLTLHTNADITTELYWYKYDDQYKAADIKKHDIYDTYADIKSSTNIIDMPFYLDTPWKLNASLGYTIGSSIALGAEYEYENYATMKLRYAEDGSIKQDETNLIKEFAKSMHTFRIGGEWKLVPEFALRAGYTYSTAPIRSDAVKLLPWNSVQTDFDFSNKLSEQNLTLGFGYRGSSFYTDMALKYNMYSENFREFDHLDLIPTKIDNNKVQLLMTLGFRF